MAKEGKDQPFLITNQSSYFLHPLDSLGAFIIAIKFDRKNYNLWEQVVSTSLKSKNKLGFIDGSITKPKRKGEYITKEERAWEMVNSMMLSILDSTKA